MSGGWTVAAAFAPTFTWTSSPPDLRLTFASGASPVDVNVATGSYRVCLAPTSGSATDFLRALQAAINTAMSGAGRAETFTVSMDEDGLVSLAISAGAFSATLSTTPLGRLLGFTTNAVNATSKAATRAPWYLLLAVAAWDGVPEPHEADAVELTSGGTVFSFSSGSMTYRRPMRIGRIPWNPTRATECSSPATPFWPDDVYLNSIGETGTNRAWSWLDVLRWCRNADVAWTLDFQTLRSSTSEYFYVGRFADYQPKPERDNPKWPRFVNLNELALWLPASDAKGTRA